MFTVFRSFVYIHSSTVRMESFKFGIAHVLRAFLLSFVNLLSMTYTGNVMSSIKSDRYRRLTEDFRVNCPPVESLLVAAVSV